MPPHGAGCAAGLPAGAFGVRCALCGRPCLIKERKLFPAMREIEVSQITDVVEKLCIEANEHLPEDVKCAIRSCRACEDGQIAQGILDNIRTQAP